MLDLQTMTKAVADVIRGLTNIVGLIENNVHSYDRLNDRHRERRLKDGLEQLLVKLTRWHIRNGFTLWLIAEWANANPSSLDDNLLLISDNDGEYDSLDWERRYSYQGQLADFLEDILDTMALLEEYHTDIIRFDHKLYRELQVGILMRRQTLVALLGMDDVKLAPKKLEELHKIYTSLVASASECKDRLQAVLDDPKPKAMSKPKAKSKSDTKPKVK